METIIIISLVITALVVGGYFIIEENRQSNVAIKEIQDVLRKHKDDIEELIKTKFSPRDHIQAVILTKAEFIKLKEDIYEFTTRSRRVEKYLFPERFGMINNGVEYIGDNFINYHFKKAGIIRKIIIDK